MRNSPYAACGALVISPGRDSSDNEPGRLPRVAPVAFVLRLLMPELTSHEPLLGGFQDDCVLALGSRASEARARERRIVDVDVPRQRHAYLDCPLVGKGHRKLIRACQGSMKGLFTHENYGSICVC